MKEENFLKFHADTIAIIGVNIAIAAMLLTLILLNTSRIDATNSRLDQTWQALLEIVKERK